MMQHIAKYIVDRFDKSTRQREVVAERPLSPTKPRSAGLSEDAASRSVWDFLRGLGGRKDEKSRRRAGLRGVTPEKRRKQYGTRK